MSGMPPAGPGYFSDQPYQTPNVADPASVPRRGLVNQVRIVVWLSLAESLLELGVAGFCLFGGLLLRFMPDEAIKQNPGADMRWLATIYFVYGGFHFALAALRIVAAVRNYSFQNRVLGIVSFCVGLVAAFGGCCAITSIGVAAYGLIVFFDQSVIEAFETRSQFSSADDLLAAFDKRPA